MRSLQLLMAALLAASSSGFFLPGMAPTAIQRTAGSPSIAQVSFGERLGRVAGYLGFRDA